MDCPSGLPKYILFSFNVLLVVFGIVLIALGVLCANIFIIVLGVIMFITILYGCCGVIKKKSRKLKTYATTLTVLCVVQVLSGAQIFLSLKDGTDVTKDARDEVEQVFQKYVNDQNNADKKKDVDDMQQVFKCCGVNNPDYWTTAVGKIPDSCFKDNNRSSTQYTEGCVSSFKNFTYSQLKTTGEVLIGVAVFELVAAIFAFMFKNTLGEQNE